MFNFYKDLAGQDMVTDAGRVTKCRLKFKAQSLKAESIKNDGPFENMSFSKKPFKDFNKKNKTNF